MGFVVAGLTSEVSRTEIWQWPTILLNWRSRQIALADSSHLISLSVRAKATLSATFAATFVMSTASAPSAKHFDRRVHCKRKSALWPFGAGAWCVSKRLGHTDARTTASIYSDALPKDDLRAPEVWDVYFQNGFNTRVLPS